MGKLIDWFISTVHGVWQQASGKDHGLRTAQRTAYPT